MLNFEVEKSEVSCLDFINEKTLALHPPIGFNGLTKAYSFHRVIGPSSSQEEVFKVADYSKYIRFNFQESRIPQMLEEVINTGASCLFIAYGQTGSGKTFTMSGTSDINDKCNFGLKQQTSRLSLFLSRLARYLFPPMPLKLYADFNRVTHILALKDTVFIDAVETALISQSIA